MYYYRTKSGLRVRMVGMNPLFAHTVGMNEKKIMFGSMLASGAFAGFASALVTLGIEFRFIQDFSPGYGMLGITIALIGGLHPFGILAAAIFYGVLMYGATLMQMNADVPFALVFLLQGVIIMLITSSNLKLPSFQKRKQEKVL
jgi:simple sugar transport system permease protein